MTEYVVDLSTLTMADLPLLMNGLTKDTAEAFVGLIARAVGAEPDAIPLSDMSKIAKAITDAMVAEPKNG
jgi:hypothetical protein